MRKVFALFLTVCMLFSCISVTATAIEVIPEGLRYSLYEDTYMVITGYTGTATELTVPDYIKGYPGF